MDLTCFFLTHFFYVAKSIYNGAKKFSAEKHMIQTMSHKNFLFYWKKWGIQLEVWLNVQRISQTYFYQV